MLSNIICDYRELTSYDYQIYRQLGEKATLKIIKKAGHLVHLERPCIYNRCLKEFLVLVHPEVSQKWSTSPTSIFLLEDHGHGSHYIRLMMKLIFSLKVIAETFYNLEAYSSQYMQITEECELKCVFVASFIQKTLALLCILYIIRNNKYMSLSQCSCIIELRLLYDSSKYTFLAT